MPPSDPKKPISFDDKKDYTLIALRPTRANGASLAVGERANVRGHDARLMCAAKKAAIYDPQNKAHAALVDGFEAAQKAAKKDAKKDA